MALEITPKLGQVSSVNFGAGPFTSSSFTPANDSLLLVIVYVAGFTTDVDLSSSLSISDSASLSWTSIGTFGSASYWSTGARAWRAPVTTGTSMTLEIDCGSYSAYNYHVHIFNFTGYDTSSPIGATIFDGSVATDGAESLTLSGTPASSSYIVGFIWKDVYPTGTSATTPGSGWTESYDQASSDNNQFTESQYITGSTSTAVPWVDVHVGTGTVDKSGACAIEIKASGGGASAVPVFMYHYMNH